MSDKKKCPFCEAIALQRFIEEHHSKPAGFGMALSAALVSYAVVNGRKCGRTTDYMKDGKGYPLNYCHPYSAYERGTNENINKMIRRFLPKGTDFRKVTAAYIQRVETWINNYPREILGFETSGSLFERYVAEAA